MAFEHRTDLMGRFADHRVAANLLMIVMIMAGIVGLTRLNTQFFPTFALDFVTVTTIWTGASAEDVERSITTPIERELRNVDHVKEMTSTSADGVSAIVLEMNENSDIGLAVDQIKELVDTVRNLPGTAEIPEVSRVVRYEPVARVLITGATEIRELRRLARRFERELLDLGIAKITMMGLPEEEIAIQVPSAELQALGVSLNEIASRVAASSRDVPVGVVGRDDTARQLRFLDQRRGEVAFEDLPVVADDSGRLVTLGDIATISRRARDGQISLLHEDKPAVELWLRRSEASDSLESARTLEDWLEVTRPQLPPGISVTVYDERWELLQQRINLLLKNGATGLILVVLILFLFLSSRVALWVMVGIPVSFLATLAVLYLIGGSINMVTLFALIMGLGIIVDDAIVVGEDAMTHFQAGEDALQAAEGGARRMFAPVMSSSLTTMAAFLPLMIVGGIIGNILVAIPVVIICVITASLVESFLILPGHLRHAFSRTDRTRIGAVRQKLDSGFIWFREHIFRTMVTKAVEFRWATLAAALAITMMTVGLLRGGHIQYEFFPSPDTTILYANVDFVAGTPKQQVIDYLRVMKTAMYASERELGEHLLATAVVRHGYAQSPDEDRGRRGDQFGSILVELTEPDTRTVRNTEFIAAWKSRLVEVPGIENLSVLQPKAGPPGRDIDIRIVSDDADSLKAAADALLTTLGGINGVYGVEHNLPFGREQQILKLSGTGKALGLSVDDVARQLRAAFDGELVQILPEGTDEVEIRVMLPDAERNRLRGLESLNIILAGGRSIPISNVVEFTSRRGFESLRHADTRLAVTVTGDVDSAIANANNIVAQLSTSELPALAAQYDVEFSFEGRQSDQRETQTDMKHGALIALGLIYLVLASVFGSYGWPLIVMAIIPFAVVGAIWGHVAMQLNLTILSMFGLFGLAGIVVNDSIILVVFYKQLRSKGMSMRQAVIESACQRLRAVLLTSLTTIGGLTPLLFETSLQAQFLIPMATSIAFGLGFATLLVLLLVPALLYIHETIAEKLPMPSRFEPASEP
ncbi:MAG: efflux RND transporter permease subunit [Gammaproteobacteria bacterium]|nr:efflux RND transporter permease subunit [Gammaproteobacteria bacterium]